MNISRRVYISHFSFLYSEEIWNNLRYKILRTVKIIYTLLNLHRIKDLYTLTLDHKGYYYLINLQKRFVETSPKGIVHLATAHVISLVSSLIIRSSLNYFPLIVNQDNQLAIPKRKLRKEAGSDHFVPSLFLAPLPLSPSFSLCNGVRVIPLRDDKPMHPCAPRETYVGSGETGRRGGRNWPIARARNGEGSTEG